MTDIYEARVQFISDEEDVRKTAIEVAVSSRVKPGVLSRTTIDPGKATNHTHLVQLISTAASAAAEYLGNKYGDDVDPGACGTNAIKAFGEECRKLALLQKDIGKKIKKLEENVGYLKDWEREVLLELSWRVNNNHNIFPRSAAFVDTTLARVYTEAKK